MTKQISSLGSSRFPRLSRTPRSTRPPRRRNLCGKQSLIKTVHLWLTTYQFLLIYVRFLCRILFDQSQTFSLRRKLSLFIKGSDLSRGIIFSQSLKPKAKSCVNLSTDLTYLSILATATVIFLVLLEKSSPLSFGFLFVKLGFEHPGVVMRAAQEQSLHECILYFSEMEKTAGIRQ